MKNRIAEALATEEKGANPGTGTEKGSETETDIALPAHDTNAATVSAARGAKDIAVREASVAMTNANGAIVRGVVASGSTKTVVSATGATGIVATVIAETEIATTRGMRGTVATVIAAARDVLDGMIATVTADMAAGGRAGAAAPLATCRP
jgi:hypothetical protein